MLPMLLRLKIKSPDTSFGLFIPLILVYILLLPAFVIAAAVYGFMLLTPETSRDARGYMRIMFHLPSLLTAARGMEVKVQSKDSDVKMFIL